MTQNKIKGDQKSCFPCRSHHLHHLLHCLHHLLHYIHHLFHFLHHLLTVSIISTCLHHFFTVSIIYPIAFIMITASSIIFSTSSIISSLSQSSTHCLHHLFYYLHHLLLHLSTQRLPFKKFCHVCITAIPASLYANHHSSFVFHSMRKCSPGTSSLSYDDLNIHNIMGMWCELITLLLYHCLSCVNVCI